MQCSFKRVCTSIATTYRPLLRNTMYASVLLYGGYSTMYGSGIANGVVCVLFQTIVLLSMALGDGRHHVVHAIFWLTVRCHSPGPIWLNPLLCLSSSSSSSRGARRDGMWYVLLTTVVGAALSLFAVVHLSSHESGTGAADTPRLPVQHTLYPALFYTWCCRRRCWCRCCWCSHIAHRKNLARGHKQRHNWKKQNVP